MLSAFATVTIDKWDDFQTLNYPHGHCILHRLHGPAAAGPGHARLRARCMIKAYGKKRIEEIVGVNIHHVLVYPGPVGAVAAAAAARGAAARRRPHADRDLALPPEGRARGDLPALARLLQPGQLAGDADQRRRPGEFLEVPPGPVVGRRRLGELRTATSAATSRRTASVESGAEHGHLGGADAQPDEGLGAVHGAGTR